MSYVVASTRNPNGFRPWNSRLSGLGADQGAPDGTVLVIQATFSVGWTGFPPVPDVQGLLAAVSARCAQSGIMVRSFQEVSRIEDFQRNTTITMQWTVQVSNGMGFGSIEDVYSILANGIYGYTGKLPITHSIPAVNQNPTGQPGGASGKGNQQDPNAPTVTFMDWFKNAWPFVAAGIGGLLLVREL